MKRPGDSWSCHSNIVGTWDTSAIYIIRLKVFGKLRLPMCSDLMVSKAYSYPNGFSVSLSAFLLNDTGVAVLMLVTAERPCHVYLLTLVPPLISPEHPLPQVLFLTIHPIVTFIY